MNDLTQTMKIVQLEQKISDLHNTVSALHNLIEAALILLDEDEVDEAKDLLTCIREPEAE